MPDHGPLSLAETIALGSIIDAAGRCAPVARLLDSGDICYGQARSVGRQSGAFLRRDDDVRDAYLRVTLRSGLEAFWPLHELVGQLEAGEFALDYEPPR